MNVERWMARRFANYDETPEVIEFVNGDCIQRVPPYLRHFTIGRRLIFGRRLVVTLQRGARRWMLRGVSWRRPPLPPTARVESLAAYRARTETR